MPIETRQLKTLNTDACPLPAATFQSAAVSRPSNLTRNNCAQGFTGSGWTITIPFGAYTSSISQADANAQANAAADALDTQTNANTNGGCTAPTQYSISSSAAASHAAACAGSANGTAWSSHSTLVVGSVLAQNSTLTTDVPAGFYKIMPNNISVQVINNGIVATIQNC
jgi:hypothetical protein